QSGERAAHFVEDVLKCRASASIMRASASFSVCPVAWTFQATATATHSPSSFRCTSTSNCMPATLPQKRVLRTARVGLRQRGLVGLGRRRVSGAGFDDRVIAARRAGGADPVGADDTAVLHERHGALGEDEAIVAERRDVVGEELALAEALLEIERGGVEGRG